MFYSYTEWSYTVPYHGKLDNDIWHKFSEEPETAGEYIVRCVYKLHGRTKSHVCNARFSKKDGWDTDNPVIEWTTTEDMVGSYCGGLNATTSTAR